MSTEGSVTKEAVNGIRTALGIAGALSLIVGILILVWPGRTAMVVTAIIAIYAIVAGLVYGGLGVFTAAMRGWSRVGHIVLGLLFIAAGVFAFFNLAATTGWFAVFLGILVGIMWIVEGVVSLTTLSDAASRGLTIVFAIISIVAGIVLLFSPLWSIAVLWWLLGVALVVLGIVQIVRAITFMSSRAIRDDSYPQPGSVETTNGLAIAAIVSVWFIAVLGLILGYVALAQIRRSGEQGRILALIAVVVGWVAIAISVGITLYLGIALITAAQ